MGSAKAAFGFSSDAFASVSADGLIIPVRKAPAPKTTGKQDKNAKAEPQWTDALRALDKAMQGQIAAAAKDEKFDGSRGKTLVFRQAPGDKTRARRIVLVGIGEAEKMTALHFENAVKNAVASVLGLNEAKNIAIALPEEAGNVSTEILALAAVDAVYQATYRSQEAKEKPPALQKVTLVTAQKASSAMTQTLRTGEILADARSFVKDLVNKPSNIKTTSTLVDAAKAIGKLNGVTAKVVSDVNWISKNMPCFFTVAQGSVASDPPKWITLEYKPKSGRAKKHVAIVGKSVIFDTGGYQVKPGDYMVTMKGDMTGGAITLATMRALSELQPANLHVTAYLAATPNKIDSNAMIPDSIVDTTCGKKVEIRHTDAEGRLTLIDAVAKAMENKPDEIITIATLTGSASSAVGMSIALMGSDEDLRDRVKAAAKTLGEPVQTLDVTEDDYDAIKSKLDGADIINTSQKKHRGAQSAAAFVMSGAPEGTPMAHLDIAGADMTPDEKATGIGAKTILQYLLSENGGVSNTGSGAPKAGATAGAKAKTTSRAAVSATTTIRKPVAKPKSAGAGGGSRPKPKSGKPASGGKKSGGKK